MCTNQRGRVGWLHFCYKLQMIITWTLFFFFKRFWFSIAYSPDLSQHWGREAWLQEETPCLFSYIQKDFKHLSTAGNKSWENISLHFSNTYRKPYMVTLCMQETRREPDIYSKIILKAMTNTTLQNTYQSQIPALGRGSQISDHVCPFPLDL